jgi:hypothetical protein
MLIFFFDVVFENYRKKKNSESVKTGKNADF